MGKKVAKSVVESGRPQDQRGDVEAHVLELWKVIEGISAEVRALSGLPAELEACRSLVNDAVALARNALDASQLARVHEDRLNNVTLAVAEGIQHVERAEARIRATVGRARRELRDAGLASPGVEAEAAQLFLDDGTQGPREGVPPVRADVEDITQFDDNEHTGIPGMTRGQIRRMYG